MQLELDQLALATTWIIRMLNLLKRKQAYIFYVAQINLQIDVVDITK